jgi:hypothetical protein
MRYKLLDVVVAEVEVVHALGVLIHVVALVVLQDMAASVANACRMVAMSPQAALEKDVSGAATNVSANEKLYH